MEIVKMAGEHLDALAELERLCFSRPWSRQALEAELQNPSAVFLTALSEGWVLGYCGMHCAAGECYMDNLAVFPEYRRQGVGSRLLKVLLEEACRLGGEFLSLEVRPSNGEAVRLYKALGFAEAGRRRNFYTAPPEDGLILTKPLVLKKP